VRIMGVSESLPQVGQAFSVSCSTHAEMTWSARRVVLVSSQAFGAR
jgi:hypothetical protein